MQRSRINKEPFIHPFPLGGCSSHLLCSLSRHFGRKLLCSEHCDLDCHWSHTSRCSEPISSSCLQGKGTVRGQTSPPLLLRSHPPPEFRVRHSLVGAGFLGSAGALQVSATFHTQPWPWTSALPVQTLGLAGVWEMALPPSSPHVYLESPGIWYSLMDFLQVMKAPPKLNSGLSVVRSVTSSRYFSTLCNPDHH